MCKMKDWSEGLEVYISLSSQQLRHPIPDHGSAFPTDVRDLRTSAHRLHLGSYIVPQRAFWEVQSPKNVQNLSILANRLPLGFCRRPG